MSLLVRTCSTDRVNASRLIARLMIIAGGALWAIMFFAQSSSQHYGDLTYSFTEIMDAGVNALIPLAVAIGVFALAWFYERLAATALLVATGGVVVWGLVAGWEMVVWVAALAVLAAPMVIAAALLFLAASTQRICELEGVV